MLSAPRGPAEPRLLPVTLEHLVASCTDFGAILLQAGQDDEITLIDHGTAVALHVTRTGLLFLSRAAALRLSDGSGGNGKRDQSESQESFTHRGPYVLTAGKTPDSREAH